MHMPFDRQCLFGASLDNFIEDVNLKEYPLAQQIKSKTGKPFSCEPMNTSFCFSETSNSKPLGQKSSWLHG